MNDDTLTTFICFSKKYQGKFRSIAAATRGEFEPTDVEGEAWLLAKEWELQNIPINFDDAMYIDKLFSHLYQQLVRYTDKKIRTGVRLDHWAYGDSESDVHPLMNSLAAPVDSQPLEALLALEAAVERSPEPESCDTRASAYLYLLRRHHNSMREVANYLMISLSYCYYRFNEALMMVTRQHTLPDTIGRPRVEFVPGPWRPFRLSRPWVQIELDLFSTADLLENIPQTISYPCTPAELRAVPTLPSTKSMNYCHGI